MGIGHKAAVATVGQGLLAIGDGRAVALHVVERPAAVEIGGGEVGLQIQRCGEIVQRMLRPADHLVGQTSIAVGRGQLGIKLDGPVVIGYRLRWPAATAQDVAEIKVAGSKVRLDLQ